MVIRSYGNTGGLRIPNATGAVSIATGLTLGGGSIAEINTGGVRALALAHDVGTNLVCGQVTVLSLSASTGAFVQAVCMRAEIVRSTGS